MEYKRLGNTGLKVSSLCFGTMTFGQEADEALSKKIYAVCRDYGVNFFDCANVYAGGESERILGNLIKEHRDEVILATKAYYPISRDINGKGGSRFHLTQALRDSLKRLDTDYIDVYYVHHFDEETPLEETLGTLNDFVRQGKVLYIGLSNFAAWQVMKAISITKQFNFAPIACIQPMYNLLKRQCESEILPMAQSENLGVFSYSPLAGGMLTGKYLHNRKEEGRFDTNVMYQKRYEEHRNIQTTEAFIEFSHENNFDPVSLAISWVGGHPGISAPIIGARSVEQLMPALKSVEIPMTDDLWQNISDLSSHPAIATDRSEE
ncbi:aldo/keto reductase [Xanthovirga aplysinae]|uniref:aldo/keto reductase n=1 Tax=Xanthovirga aplysinae TaxID=2529853 RepID=UPI001656C250|nr:aldo/keto reductase [Xanthovirga aplysinae]